jgi:hypothetical protein
LVSVSVCRPELEWRMGLAKVSAFPRAYSSVSALQRAYLLESALA